MKFSCCTLNDGGGLSKPFGCDDVHRGHSHVCFRSINRGELQLVIVHKRVSKSAAARLASTNHDMNLTTPLVVMEMGTRLVASSCGASRFKLGLRRNVKLSDIDD